MREPYRADELRRLMAPRSVAVVGASPTPTSLGWRTLQNLQGFAGRVYPVNARYGEIAAQRCFASLADLPEVPDCVVLAVGKDQVEAVARDCAARGVGSLVVFASGYAEIAAPDGAASQQWLAEIGRTAGMRIVGPNCAGLASHRGGACVAFASFRTALPPGSKAVGLVSQSGALGLSLSQAVEHGAAISHVLSCGNSCDVDVADYVGHLANDGDCHAIALVFEGVGEPARLAAAARRAASAGKSVIACKLAASVEGAAAARFHTATPAGTREGFAALAAEAGIIAIDRVETLIETAAFFAKARGLLARGSGIGVISASGGTAILAADVAARHGVALPPLAAATADALRAALPAFAAIRNPCDVTAQAAAQPDMMVACARAMLADPSVAALIAPWGRTLKGDVLERLGVAGREAGKPVCIVWMSQWLEGHGAADAMANPDIALFRSMDSCVAALAAWLRAAR